MNAASLLFSYIDPVSGVILLQLFIGGGIGCIARFRHKIWRFGARFFSKQQVEEELHSEASAELPLIWQPSGEIESSASIASLEGSLADQNSHERREERIAA